MPKESDWILHTPYNDKTLMRNYFTCAATLEMMRLVHRIQFVDVVSNGDYIGIYVLMEKIKQNANRTEATVKPAERVMKNQLI